MKVLILVLVLFFLWPAVVQAVGPTCNTSMPLRGRPIEVWVPFPYWFYSEGGVLRKTVAVTYRNFIVYYGTTRNGQPYIDPMIRRHENIHWDRIQAVGYDKWLLKYHTDPEFACREEQIAGLVNGHWRCEEWIKGY